MNKSIRKSVYDKFGGKCAYTGKTLPKDWQVDHIFPLGSNCIGLNDIDNLFPALPIVNHYKRCLGLQGFRERMISFHLRLAKLPKKTNCDKTKARIVYMNKVADAFGITVDNPFSGVFYFEKLINEQK